MKGAWRQQHNSIGVSGIGADAEAGLGGRGVRTISYVRSTSFFILPIASLGGLSPLLPYHCE